MPEETEKKKEVKKEEVLKPQQFEEIKQYDLLKVLKLHAGLPIFTTAPTYTGFEGEMLWLNDGTYYSLYAYLNKGWRQIGTTDLTDSGETAAHIHDGRYYTETEVNNLITIGGDSSDGAKTVSANEDLDASSAIYVLKQYSSLTIDATKILGLTNPADEGTLLHIKVRGNCVINGKIDLSDDGGKGGIVATGESSGGNDGYGGSFNLCPQREIKENLGGSTTKKALLNLYHGGRGGSSGSAVSSLNKDAGGGSGGGGYEHGADGGVGTTTTVDYGYAVKAGLKQVGAGNAGYHLQTCNRVIIACCGGGGGSGGTKKESASGVGGRGGGGLIMEVGGNITFGAASEIDLSGENGGNPTNAYEGAGGGGGGGGGIGIILYNGTLTNSGLTKTVTAGTGGTGTSTSGDGGAGGAGRIELIKNYHF